MAINFPNNPVDGTTYDFGGVRYQFDGATSPGYWKVVTPGTVSAATGAEVTAGTDNAKFVTPLAMENSDYWNAHNDGAGSGMDADLLDGKEMVYVKAGRKNLLINGDFTINQRSGTLTPGIGVYGFDRWKGHASGLEQIVEEVPSGLLTLSWVGGGSGSIDGSSGPSPLSVTPASTTEVSVTVPTTSTKVQLEKGDAATDFEYRPIGEELALCQRYYWRGRAARGADDYKYGANSTIQTFRGAGVDFPVTMRTIPTCSIVTAPTYTNCTSQDIAGDFSGTGLVHRVVVTVNGRYRASQGIYDADAEL